MVSADYMKTGLQSKRVTKMIVGFNLHRETSYWTWVHALAGRLEGAPHALQVSARFTPLTYGHVDTFGLHNTDRFK